jgi:hypothetical protein
MFWQIWVLKFGKIFRPGSSILQNKMIKPLKPFNKLKKQDYEHR